MQAFCFVNFMSVAKTILIVDDTRSVVRTLLESSERDYHVVLVPSAEEGLLELGLSRYDLLIANVHLPGMDGFELVRQAKRRQPDLPVFMVVERLSAMDRRQGDDLGVGGYFTKPLEREGLLTAVSTTLSLDSTPPNLDLRATEPLLPLAMIQNRLTNLRADISASGVMFIDLDGKILIQDLVTDAYDWPYMVRWLQEMMQSSLALAADAQSKNFFTLQYHALDSFKLYSANVGRGYFLVLCFTTAAQVGGISMVSVFTQRAIKDLLLLLDDADSSDGLIETSELVGQAVDAESLQAVENLVVAPKGETAPEETAEPLTEAEMAKLLALDFDMALDEADLDAFWSQPDDGEASDGAGLSLEEARRRGLIPDIFGSDDD